LFVAAIGGSSRIIQACRARPKRRVQALSSNSAEAAQRLVFPAGNEVFCGAVIVRGGFFRRGEAGGREGQCSIG
jgi:hypothetical protein